MRHGLTFLTGAAIALSACGNKGEADAAANADIGLTADRISANDVTAIDAVTGEAANMAADVDYSNMIDPAGDGGNGAAIALKPKTRAPAGPTAKSPPKPTQSTDPAEPANAAQ